MEIYTISRTSQDTAECDPVVLREKTTTRLVFKPRLVNNAQDENAPVNGSFVYQRKRPNDQWEEQNELLLSNLKADEWVKLDLGAGEIHTLVQHLAALYRVYRQQGLPVGKVHFLKIAAADADASALSAADVSRLQELSRRTGVDVFTRLVEWSTELGNAAEVLQRLEDLDISTLQRLSSLAGISSLKKVLEKWESNQTNQNEEFWQTTLQNEAFVLSQVFSFPILVIKGKAYVGGKVIDNTGGHLVDYLVVNPLTRNAAMIEIKTPVTPLLGGKYRGVYSISEELSGTLVQVLDYRYSLTTDFLSVRRGYEESFDVFSPQCVVIAGHAKNHLPTEEHQKAFEMFRMSLRDVIVLTYDELFGKTRELIEALEGTATNRIA